MISFYYHEIIFKLFDQAHLKSWISTIVAEEKREIENLSFVFCDDEYLLEINRTHLDHDYYTDIITFDLTEHEAVLVGEMYISIPRIRENAQENHSTFADELHRVMIHGVLHLLGFGDKGEEEAKEMRLRENKALGARMFHVKQYKEFK